MLKCILWKNYLGKKIIRIRENSNQFINITFKSNLIFDILTKIFTDHDNILIFYGNGKKLQLKEA